MLYKPVLIKTKALGSFLSLFFFLISKAFHFMNMEIALQVNPLMITFVIGKT